jgi:hypothetical protein
VGCTDFNKAGRRERPPEVVSPLMLALRTVAGIFWSASLFSSKATQPLPRFRPYSALRLSPTTRIVGEPGFLVAAAAGAWA